MNGSPMYEEHEHALIVRRADSVRLTLIFSGLSRRIWGLGPFEFLRRSGLENNNFIFLWDVRNAGYACGCSRAIDDFDALLAWVDAQLPTFPNLREIVCIGVSSGTLASMVTAEHVRAACSIVFGPRHPPVSIISTVPHRGTPVRVTAIDRVLRYFYELESSLRRQFKLRAREWVPPGIVNAALQDAAPILRRLDPARGMVHHLFYVPTNMPDRTFIRHLRRQGVTLVAHPVWPGPGYSRRGAGWDHAVVAILIASGTMKEAITKAMLYAR